MSTPSVRLEAEQYNSFVSNLVVKDIVMTRVCAERTAPGVATSSRFDLQGGFAIESDALHCQFLVKAEVLDEVEKRIGVVDTTLVVVFGFGAPPTEQMADQFSRTSAASIAVPYAREAIASAAMKVGLFGVTMPLFVTQPQGNGEFQPEPAGPSADGSPSS